MSLGPTDVKIFATVAGKQIALLADAAGRFIVSPPTTSTGNQANIIQLQGVAIPAAGDFGLVTASVAFGANVQTGVFDNINEDANNYDGQPVLLFGNLLTNAQAFAFNGATFDRVRVANVFKSVAATALGNTVVWTPAAGKKFRLMGYAISVSGTLAASGVQVIQLLDSATIIGRMNAGLIQTRTANISGGDSQAFRDLGQGRLSAVANNVLNVNLSTAMADGSVTVDAWGTEE